MGHIGTILLCVFGIASSTLGIQCINDKTKSSERFLIFHLVYTILALLIAFFAMYRGV